MNSRAFLRNVRTSLSCALLLPLGLSAPAALQAQHLPTPATEQVSNTGNEQKLVQELIKSEINLIQEVQKCFQKAIAKTQAKALDFERKRKSKEAQKWNGYVQKMRETQDLPEEVSKSEIGSDYRADIKKANDTFIKVLQDASKKAKKQGHKRLSTRINERIEEIKKTPITFAMVRMNTETVRTGPTGPASTVADKVKPEHIVDLSTRGGFSVPDKLSRTPTNYLYIPLIGPFGESITAEGVIKSIRYAKSKGIQHIVFYLDSGGGYIHVADKIQEEIKKHDDDMDFHVVIKNAISASIWVVFACDTIHMLPNGTVGGAVVYSQNRSTGNTQVDAKMNSIIAAQMEATAKSKGHPHLLAQPMILMDAEVYAWDQGRGKVAMARIKPRGQSLLMGDDRRTVVTLTTDQAVSIGLARPLATLDDIGKQLGLGNFTNESTYGERTMRTEATKAAAEAKKLQLMIQKFQKDWSALETLYEQAQRKDPKFGRYMMMQNGQFTRQSQIDWVRNTDAAIKKWKEVEREFRSATRALKAIQRIRGDADTHVPAETLEKIKLDIDNYLDTLKANRRRTSPPSM